MAEKLVHLQHQEWLKSRPKPTPEGIAKALAILDRPAHPPEASDELPEGYVSVRATQSYRRALSGKSSSSARR